MNYECDYIKVEQSIEFFFQLTHFGLIRIRQHKYLVTLNEDIDSEYGIEIRQ